MKNRVETDENRAALDADIQLVIFDCDGVLVDSEIISATVLVAELSQVGIALDVEQATERFLGRSFPAIAASLYRDFSIRLPDEFEDRYRTCLLTAFDSQLQPTPGIDRLLSQLSVAKCVATSSSVPRASRALAVTGLDRYFANALFTASEVRQGKPAPDLFLHAAERMGVPPSRCLVIEDSGPGLEAAKRAGMISLFYAGGSHMRGRNASWPGVSASLGRVESWDEVCERWSILLK